MKKAAYLVTLATIRVLSTIGSAQQSTTAANATGAPNLQLAGF
jgi:hypothetical protein